MRLTLISVLVLALCAPPAAWAQRAAAPAAAAPIAGAAPSAAWTADTVVVRSAALGRDRIVYVSLPESHARTTRTYPIVLVLDGEWNFAEATDVTRRLARLGHAPEAIVVGVANASSAFEDRVHDMTPPGLSVSGSSLNEGGDRFLDYLEREVVPLVRERYRGGGPTILAGHSSGGVIATYAAATRPSAFPVVLSIDAPVHLGDEWLAARMLDAARSARGPLRYVSLEARFGWPERAWAELEAARPATWRLYRDRLEGESHESMTFLAMYEGLKFAFADYSIVGAPIPPRGSALAAFDHYRGIGLELGGELPPPGRVLRQLIEDLLTEGQVEPARAAMRWLVEGYGDVPDRGELEAMIARIAALPPLDVTVAELRATPRATAAEIAPFVGEWRGEYRINENARWPVGLRLRIEGDSAIAEIIESGGGEERIARADYLRVVPGGLEFGRMNGMRPLGMLVSSARVDGDTMEGRQQFRGIVLPLPAGHMPPVVTFRLERQ